MKSWLFFPRRMNNFINDYHLNSNMSCWNIQETSLEWWFLSRWGFPPHCILFSGWSGTWGELWQCWVDIDPEDWKAAKSPVRILLHVKQSQNELVWIERFQKETFHMRAFLHISLGDGGNFFFFSFHSEHETKTLCWNDRTESVPVTCSAQQRPMCMWTISEDIRILAWQVTASREFCVLNWANYYLWGQATRHFKFLFKKTENLKSVKDVWWQLLWSVPDQTQFKVLN